MSSENPKPLPSASSGVVAHRRPTTEKRKRKRPASSQHPTSRELNSRSSSECPGDSATSGKHLFPSTKDDKGNAQAQATEETDDIANAGHAAEDELAKEHLVEFFSQDLQDNPIQARSTYVGNELSNLNYLVRQRSVNQRVYHYPCSNVYVPRVFRNSQISVTPNLIPKDAFVIPPKHISDVLIAEYFELVHPGLPIIDKDRFLRNYHDPDSAPSTLLFQAVCLVGSHVTRKFKNNQEMKAAFFRRAKVLLEGRYEEDRMHVVQTALLLTWFSDGGDDICANSWWWIGIAARTAIGLGMHREVGPSKMPQQDKIIWRKIWWCVVQFDCLVTLVYGRPQQVNLDDCDVPDLEPQDFEGEEDSVEVDFVVHHSKLCALISGLVRSHFSVRAAKQGIEKRMALDAIDAALAEWLMSLPPLMASSSAPGPWSSLLHLTYNTVLLQFHRSASHLTGNSHDSERTGDEEICSDASTNIIQIFETLHQNSFLRSCWFSGPSSLFAAMLQISGQLQSANPILALRARTKYESSLVTLRKLSRYWLFATSVWRLFQSNSIRAEKEKLRKNGESTVPAATDEVSPPQFSPADLSVSSIAGPGSNSEQIITGGSSYPTHTQHSTEMDWVQMLSFNDPNLTLMNVESNRWQNNPDQWNSLYFSDPLANIQLGDHFAYMQFQAPP
ncbi:fungal specific transcription factor [Pochonia chlamydosporia 170]|uniref:Fungal specific transcription factor n=1 Tax=Pochonia chlamydosporia 170 TaxID=1380566 RepID=A0A179FKP9_METCM|nr:fungal specific transcription factor [Pochonia chlamydosporia 170]OAQ65877.2 fungal specific transcription factor [Pochonia chlamydosporia 170]